MNKSTRANSDVLLNLEATYKTVFQVVFSFKKMLFSAGTKCREDRGREVSRGCQFHDGVLCIYVINAVS